MKTGSKIVAFVIFILAVSAGCTRVWAQTADPATQQPRKASTRPAPSGPVIMENRPSAPQVVTILHHLNGLKMFRLLLRSGKVSAITRLDEAFKLSREVHTNVIAGLALDDAQTVAAWLPEAAAEMVPLVPPTAPKALLSSSVGVGWPVPPASAERLTAPAAAGDFFEQPDLSIVMQDGQRLTARYIGLDGATGLSILKLASKDLPRSIDATEKPIAIGQHLRLFGPEPAAQPETGANGIVYVRMGETDGKVAGVTRGPTGGIARLAMESPGISPAIIGWIAINDAGETVGIVNAIERGQATILPTALIRSAAKRVLERQSSVPRPWLGVRGEPISAVPLEQVLRSGWEIERAKSLVGERRGVFLTSVASGSPASGAALRPGDVILGVNDGEVRNADDLSWLLEQSAAGAPVRFTVARPDRLAPEAVEIKLSESPDPLFGLRTPEALARQMPEPGPPSNSLSKSLIAEGIETIALTFRVASRFGAKGGLLVVYVQRAVPAFKAGLRSGDVIEAINGQLISLSSHRIHLSATPGVSNTFSVVRNKEKLLVTVASSPK